MYTVKYDMEKERERGGAGAGAGAEEGRREIKKWEKKQQATDQ